MEAIQDTIALILLLGIGMFPFWIDLAECICELAAYFRKR